MAEQRPDIHELFCHYSSLYFNDALGTCIISWSPCLTSTESSCDCLEEGICEIQLSIPLLKGRSSADLKNILLHEMIHAFLWIVHKNNNHSDHGSEFWNIANAINSNLIDDYQRPSNGYNITSHHGFQNEVNTYNAYLHKCDTRGDQIEGLMDEGHSFIDCIEKNDDDNYCGNLLYRWPKCEKVDGNSGSKVKGKSVGVSENEGRAERGSSHFNGQSRQKPFAGEKVKDKRVIKRPRIMEEYLLFRDDDKPKSIGKKSSQADCSNCKGPLVMDLRTESLAMGPEIPRLPRTCWKFSNTSNTEELKCRRREREISLVMQLFGVYTDEESEEDLEPLMNKRSEWRKRMKLSSSSGGNGEQTPALMPREVISLD